MGEYNRIFEPSQTKISSAKIFHPKPVTKVTRARLESSIYFGIRSSEYQRHEVQFPWCTMRGLCSFRFSQGPMHVCILKNIEGLLLLPLIGYNTLAIEVILNSR